MKKLLLVLYILISTVHFSHAQCTNFTPYLSATASTVAGTTVNISICTYQTEYNTINGIVAGNTYTITYNLGGCVTVHSGSNSGPVIAWGNAPLTFTSTFTGTVYVSYNTNCTTCGTATNCGTTTIQTISTSGGGGSGGGGGCIGGQNNNCSTADPFCSSQSYTYCNTTGVTGAGQYNCLFTTPNPMWMYLNVAQSGPISITINQYTNAGVPIDVDFALWGPFSSLSAACAGIAPSTVIPPSYPSGNLVDCSYSTLATEVADIPNGVAGQFYMLLITNYAGSAGYIQFNQSGGTGITDCNILSPTTCAITNVTATPTGCAGSNQYSVSGAVTFTNPPATGTLSVTSSCGGSQTFNAPFTSPLNYNLTGIAANGGNCTVTASFSATTCTGTGTYTAPSIPVVSGANQTICSGGTLNIPLTSTVVGSTFGWSAANNGQVTGESTTNQTTNLINNTLTNSSATSQTVTYSVTATANGCQSTPVQIAATINPSTVPTFNQVAPICSGGTFTLPPTSTNGISGTWSPTLNNTSTTTYTFTPSANQCASTATMTVTVNPLITPAFTQVAAICSGGVLTFPTISNNSITGSWSPAVNNTATTTYIFTPTSGQCAGQTNMTVTVNPAIVPTFTQVAAICNGGSFTLPTSSNNAITGTWSPAVNNTATTTYTFTPTTGQCTTTATMTVTVNQPVAPLFTQLGPFCSGTSFTLPTLSTNSISGTWSPAVNNTATTTYTFTPTAGQCATSATMTVAVNQPTVPTFTQIAQTCSGGTIALPTASLNAINGTWSPAVNNTATTTYTFIPNAGQCATITTMTVTVGPATTPTFTQISPICNGGSFTLPTASLNGINGTWSPAVNNTATTTYTFTPTGGLCATTATMTVTVNQPVTPTFNAIAPICNGGTFTLPTISTNGITGTWSPAINNTVTTTYTFTPTAGQCATTTTRTVIVNQPTVPSFTQISPICSGGTFTLPLTSTNSISGTWSPALNNTATTTYTFTPTAGVCVTTATMSVTVNQPTVPTFTQVAAICNGGSFTLPTASLNGINGTWSPAVNNTATTTYTFTPTTGQCATSATMTVTVNQPITPTFPSAGPFCLNDILPQVMLPTTSLNGVNGTWNPGMLSTATAGTFAYTFTPNASECALPYSMTVTVNDPVVPTFNQLAPLCSGAIFTLPSTSTNSISGSWSPAINNTATTTYTFTPNVGVCATTAAMTVEIGAQILPSFVPDITTGCIPLTVNFTNTSANSVDCSWNFGNGTSQAGCGPVSATFTAAGCYDITLTVTDINGCSGTLTANNLICMEAAPDVSFNPSTGVISQLNTNVSFNNTTTGAVSYDWDFGDDFGSAEFEPTHTYPDEPNGYTVTLIATSAAGCIDSASAVIQYFEELILYIPNTFTPDDNMYNQTFKPVFTSGFDPYDYNLFIYNRWGELIFESKDANFGWDGTYGIGSQNRKVQDGTYSYQVYYKLKNNDFKSVVSGHVNVIR